jgi:plasmid maintenance system antidote protein VapI
MIDTLKASGKNQLMTGDELRKRFLRLGMNYIDAAQLLGLTRAGVNHQMRGLRQVSRQTQLLIDVLGHRAVGRHGQSAGTAALHPASLTR